MAAVSSTMLALGTAAPDFTLPDTVSGKPVNLTAFRAGRPALVMFICNHCPFVVHLRGHLAAFAADATKRGVAVLAISANDPERYPDDAPAKIFVGRPVTYTAGKGYTGATSTLLVASGADHIGEVQAWNVDTGKRVWTHTFPKSTNWGPMLSTGGGLVFKIGRAHV